MWGSSPSTTLQFEENENAITSPMIVKISTIGQVRMTRAEELGSSMSKKSIRCGALSPLAEATDGQPAKHESGDVADELLYSPRGNSDPSL